VNRRVVRSALARRDIAQEAVYLGRDDPDQVDRFLKGIDESCERLTHGADAGSPFEYAPASMPDMRYVLVKHFPKHLVFYRVVGDMVRVHRLLHSARDLPSLLDPDE